MRFDKWQALGNDYMLIEHDKLPFTLTPARIRALCAPHTGVAADGVVLLSAPERPAARGRLVSKPAKSARPVQHFHDEPDRREEEGQ